MRFFLRKYKPHYNANLKLAAPVIVSQLGHTLVQTADAIVVGHFIGTIALAAVSLVNSIFIIPMIIGLGISYGATPIIAQLNSQKEYKECGRLLTNSLLINTVTGTMLFLILYSGSLFVLHHLQQSPQVVEQARPFLFLLGLSLIPMLIFNTFKQFAEGLGFTKQAMYISIIGNILNISLGIIFVKGLFGITPMGIRGVGYATLIDRCLMAIVMGTDVSRSDNFKEYLKGLAFKNITGLRISQIFKMGAPIALQYTFEISAFSAAGIMVGIISPIQQAAHQVALSLASITYMISSGIAAAATITSGNYFGVKKHKALRTSALSNYHIVLTFMCITALIFAFGNHILPYIYTTDKMVLYFAAQLLIITAIFQLFDGAQVVGLGILRGMGDVNIPTVITFLAYWLLGLPVSYYLGVYLKQGVTGVWYDLLLGLMVSAGLMFLRFQFVSKSNQQKIIR